MNNDYQLMNIAAKVQLFFWIRKYFFVFSQEVAKVLKNQSWKTGGKFPHFNWYAAGKNETAGRKSSDLENVEKVLINE